MIIKTDDKNHLYTPVFLHQGQKSYENNNMGIVGSQWKQYH